MPTTRKKVLKTVYKDGESECETGDFSDSGSEAIISETSSTDEDIVDECDRSSADDSRNRESKTKKGRKEVNKPPIQRRKPKFTKDLVNKINRQVAVEGDDEIVGPSSQFSVKDLSEADKLLPTFLNLSESDSSDDESQTQITKKKAITLTSIQEHNSDNDKEYRDVWSSSLQDDSEEIAKKTFMELEKHKSEIEQTKASIESYVSKNPPASANVSKTSVEEFNVNDLLAQGEDVIEKKIPTKSKLKARKRRDSDSELEDWEEVNEAKSIPQQGLQLYVEFPNTCKKSKKVDLEMMMKRKMNRVKKEYQVYMHKVHVLCWLGHGNYVSRDLNEQEVMAAALAMVPKGCYPEQRLTVKYVEQITTWYKDKLILKQDKNEYKFRPKAPPLKTILLNQIKSRVTTAKKYNIFIFVAMLRALGLQCRVMFNFVTVPIRPSSSELCSLSTKPKNESTKEADKSTDNAGKKSTDKSGPNTTRKSKANSTKNIAQVDGIYDSFSDSDSDNENIMQLDGNNDAHVKTRNARSTRAKKTETNIEKDIDDGVSPPKRAKNLSDNRKTTKERSDTNEDQPLEAPKAPLRKIPFKKNIASATKTEHCELLQKDVKTIKNIEGDKDILRNVPKIAKHATAKTENSKNSEIDGNVTSNREKPQGSTLPLKRSARNRVNTLSSKNTTASTNPESSKSPQPRNNHAKTNKPFKITNKNDVGKDSKTQSSNCLQKATDDGDIVNLGEVEMISSRRTRSNRRTNKDKAPTIIVTDENEMNVESKFFPENQGSAKRIQNARKRSHTAVVAQKSEVESNIFKAKTRAKSAPGMSIEKSKYFDSDNESLSKKVKLDIQNTRQMKKDQLLENKLRVSHRDLRQKAKPKNDVTEDLVDIIKSRIKVEKAESKKGIIKGKVKDDSDSDSDFLIVEESKSPNESDDDFKPTKISPRPSKIIPKPGTSKMLDRRVLSSDDDVNLMQHNKVDVWCEVFVEELEQWIAVDVIKGKVHCTSDIYSHATHPICYIVGWDNNNYLKDLTRRYVPHWNTVTRKQRTEPGWWGAALEPWQGPRTARDKEEDHHLDMLQLEAPLPKTISEYKNHPLYALKRHLLKFEALYPPDAQTLGFVRGEAVYPRDCVFTCQSRDKWLKEAKVVRLGEQPYKVVKARPKWDRLSNKCITDKPLEVFGPWQVQDYEPPTAEHGLVPRNAYGNVELFKDCMLPKKTVHIKLPGLNKIAKKLNIDCAPAMTGFDFNGGFSHPVYDGFVVCEEFKQIITEAWVEDQEYQEQKEREKIDLRVYGNWKRLIRGLMIRERLKLKYGFEEPTAAPAKPKSKGPRLLVKKN